MLGQILNFGFENDHTSTHFKVKKLKEPKGSRRVRAGDILTVDECFRLYAAADGPRNPVLFRMAVETGMRQGELFALRTDIDWKTGHVWVRRSCRMRQEKSTKTGEQRRLDLTPALLSQLKVWKLRCPKAPPDSKVRDLVFPNSAGGFEDPRNLLDRDFYPALRRAGLREVRFHDLRHTCASHLLALRMPIKVVQAHLGHASAKMTLDVYGHLMPDDSSPVAAALEAMYRSRAVATDSTGGGGLTLTNGSESGLPAPDAVGDLVG